MNEEILRKPEWLKIKVSTNKNYQMVKQSIKEGGLNTVCQEAKCPNLHECWNEHKTATFMILGDTCTRRCRFCSVKTGMPQKVDPLEPLKVAQSIKDMGVRHAVITMVDRDDLPDGGAEAMAATVRAIRNSRHPVSIEILTGDFMANPQSLDIVAQSEPDIFSHNLETVRELTPLIRSRSEYDRSLKVLQMYRERDPKGITKSSLMLGLGETREQVLQAMEDLRAHGVQMINLGQYLQPTKQQIPVKKYWSPEEFADLKEAALGMGFRHCEAGPLVRSSYHAGDSFSAYKRTKG